MSRSRGIEIGKRIDRREQGRTRPLANTIDIRQHFFKERSWTDS
jgi:hypothetical protein